MQSIGFHHHHWAGHGALRIYISQYRVPHASTSIHIQLYVCLLRQWGHIMHEMTGNPFFILHREWLYLSGVTISICFGSLMTAWILGQRMLMGNMERSLSTSPCMIRAQNGAIQKTSSLTLPSRMCSSTRLVIDALLPSEHTIPGHGTNCFSFDAKLSVRGNAPISARRASAEARR
jgi:hypothetical protein